MPFLVIGVTLVVFVRTRDPMVFAYAGLLACIYVLGVFMGARLRRRRRSR